MEGLRKGNWMQTYTGRQFWPLDPRSEDIHHLDIAHALSNICRFGGHVEKFYSVAEHSVHMANYAPREFKLWALLHDATEAYIVDIPRPIKPFLTNYVEIESNLMGAIATKYNLSGATMPVEVKLLDNRILFDEAKQNLKEPPVPWANQMEPLGVLLRYWEPEVARERWLDLFHQLTDNKYLWDN